MTCALATRTARLATLLALLALAAVATACAGERGAGANPAADGTGQREAAAADASPALEAVDPYALDRALLQADRRLAEAGGPLVDCLDDPGCEVRSRRPEAVRLAAAVDVELDALERAMARAPEACAQKAARAAVRSYRTLRGVAEAADERAAGRALRRAAEQAVDVTYALAGCSPFRGRNAAALRAAQVEAANAERRTRLRLVRCGARATCVRREGAALARTAAAAVDELRPAVDRLQDRCARELSRRNLARLDAYRRLGAAAQRLDQAALQAARDALDTSDRGFATAYLRCLAAPGRAASTGTS